MNVLPREFQIAVIKSLLETSSIRATSRNTGVSKTTILKLLEKIGYACWDYYNLTFRNLPFTKVQCDEIWSFFKAKKKNATQEQKDRLKAGDTWTYFAIDVESRFVFSWVVAYTREQGASDWFMWDVDARLKNKFELFSDGNPQYLESIESDPSLLERIENYGIMQKTYKMENGKRNTKNLDIKRIKVIGDPYEEDISTAYIERFNGTVRHHIRRFTRKTYCHSKSIYCHEHHVSLFCIYYNFVRPHLTFGNKTPAMVAGLTDRRWEVEDLIDLMNGYLKRELKVGVPLNQ